jgi:hypothetical protein
MANLPVPKGQQGYVVILFRGGRTGGHCLTLQS